MLYLDNNATTRVDPVVAEAMQAFYAEDFGNASSVHSYGQKARAAVEDAREQVAELVGAEPREVVFTSGGTEADNLAVLGTAWSYRTSGNRIVTAKTEHPAILRSCEFLERQGFEVVYVDVHENGVIRFDELVATIDENTVLISIMMANNETGTLQPISEIGRLAKERGIVFHTDAVQGVGKIPIQMTDLNADLLSLSAHKFHGPKGVGALVVREGVELAPVMLGGSHEGHRRGGTQNVPGIVGLGLACQTARQNLKTFIGDIGRMRDVLEQGILERIDDVVVNGAGGKRLAHVSNVSFRGVHGESLLIALDMEGVAVSTGAACSSGSISPSHVLTAMGLPTEVVNGAIRFSLGKYSTKEDVQYVLETLPRLVARMREMRPADTF